jgi:hypothetical protein
MVEGTRDGLRRLNNLRLQVGLPEIPDRAEDNISSLKFEEAEIEEYLAPRFDILNRHYFGLYYLISRVVHPLLVKPLSPRFDAPINGIARMVNQCSPDYGNIGHVTGWVLRKRQV